MLQRFLATPQSDPVAQLGHDGRQSRVIAVQRRLQVRHDGAIEVLGHVAAQRAGVRVDGYVNLFGAQTRMEHGYGENGRRALEVICENILLYCFERVCYQRLPLTIDILEERLEFHFHIGQPSQRPHVDGVHQQAFHRN